MKRRMIGFFFPSSVFLQFWEDEIIQSEQSFKSTSPRHPHTRDQPTTTQPIQLLLPVNPNDRNRAYSPPLCRLSLSPAAAFLRRFVSFGRHFNSLPPHSSDRPHSSSSRFVPFPSVGPFATWFLEIGVSRQLFIGNPPGDHSPSPPSLFFNHRFFN